MATETGKPAVQVLPELLAALLDGLRWTKTMRWNSSATYPRPLRWIVALYGEQVVPLVWAGVAAGNVSRGPRYADAVAKLEPGGFTTFAIASAQSYGETVAAQDIVLDRDERRSLVWSLVGDAAATVNGVVPEDSALLDEVTDLIESPQALLGNFERKYLELPMPVLIGVMKKHQRYFNVMRDGKMLPHFVTVANAHDLQYPDVVVAGNEGVIRARYADAAYFYRQDSSRHLESYTERLKTLTFHEQLGSMFDKVERLKQLAPQIAAMLGASASEMETVTRAAELSKSDLVTSMVVEMTSLEGIMGEIYAANSGETSEVAAAIREHYLPRYAGDAAPQTTAGLALSLADKLDSISGLFAAGAMPTGSADPFGLRRAALGIVNNLLAADIDFDIAEGLQKAAGLQPVDVSSETLAEANDFITRRLQGVLLDAGFAHDVVAAVLEVRGGDPTAAVRACTALTAAVAADGWSDAFTAYARCARITRNLPEKLPLNEAAYLEPVEQTLHAAYKQAASALAAANEPAERLGQVLVDLRTPIDTYFDTVLVNAEEPTLREARLALVQSTASLPSQIADLSKLQGF